MADLLRREERLEDKGEIHGRNARACVSDPQEHVGYIMYLLPACCHGQSAAVRHGIYGIAYKIVQGLPDLVLVYQDRLEVFSPD